MVENFDAVYFNWTAFPPPADGFLSIKQGKCDLELRRQAGFVEPVSGFKHNLWVLEHFEQRYDKQDIS